MSLEFSTINNQCVLHRWIKDNFVVGFIAYHTFDFDLMECLQVIIWNYGVQESSASYVISIQK